MKLIFSKNAQNEIDAKIQKGTISEDFTYTEMVKQLLQDKTIEDPDFDGLDEDQQKRIKSMLGEIGELFK